MNDKKGVIYILTNPSFPDYAEYKVIPYMCMNKVLISRYKKIAFPIVSYPELEEIISGVIRE